MHNDVSLGDLLTLAGMVFMAGGAWWRLRSLEQLRRDDRRRTEDIARRTHYLSRCVERLYGYLRVELPTRLPEEQDSNQ